MKLLSIFFQLNDLASQFKDLYVRLAQAEAESKRVAQQAAIGKISQKIAHDVKSPFDRMLLCFESIKRSSDKTEALRILENAIPRLEASAAMVKEMLLDIMSVGSDVILRKTDVCITQLCENVVQDIGQIPSNVKVHIETENQVVNVDRVKFYRVFANLIKNALKAMPTGGEIFIGSETTGEEGSKSHVFRVTNTGSYISELLDPDIKVTAVS